MLLMDAQRAKAPAPAMMGQRQVTQGALFYEFSRERHVPGDHLLRSIGRLVDLGDVRKRLAPLYGATGRPPVDPEHMIRMLLVGYFFGIRSERRLCGRKSTSTSPTAGSAAWT
jgi:transposase